MCDMELEEGEGNGCPQLPIEVRERILRYRLNFMLGDPVTRGAYFMRRHAAMCGGVDECAHCSLMYDIWEEMFDVHESLKYKKHCRWGQQRIRRVRYQMTASESDDSSSDDEEPEMYLAWVICTCPETIDQQLAREKSEEASERGTPLIDM
jgi:hypothetical protein